MEALEVYLVMLPNPVKVWSLKELINTVLILHFWRLSPFCSANYYFFHWRTEKSVDFLEK